LQLSESFQQGKQPNKRKNNTKEYKMKKEYDFSKAERGKFYRKDVKLNLPVYLDPDNLQFVEKIAKEKKLDMSSIVNKLIKENRKIAQVFR
jgi:hypothetical protein